jgi:phospholipid transport system substrate-binding protein
MALAERLMPPRQPVEKLNAALIEVMKNARRLGYAGRYKKLKPAVKEVFQFQFQAIAQVARVPYWNKLDEGQRQAFVAKLTDLSIATYASQLNAYEGQTFRYDDTEDTKPDRAIVRYAMLAPREDKAIKVEYIVNRSGPKWRIVNVAVDGISDLALKKSQYASIVDRKALMLCWRNSPRRSQTTRRNRRGWAAGRCATLRKRAL